MFTLLHYGLMLQKRGEACTMVRSSLFAFKDFHGGFSGRYVYSSQIVYIVFRLTLRRYFTILSTVPYVNFQDENPPTKCFKWLLGCTGLFLLIVHRGQELRWMCVQVCMLTCTLRPFGVVDE